MALQAIAQDFEADLKAEMVARLRRADLLRDDKNLQACAIARCKHSLVDWVGYFGVTYDPRRQGAKIIPFKPFPRQIEYLEWRQARRSLYEIGVVEKSRDAGITWLNVFHQVHCWLFENDFAGGFGSRKLDLVDKLGDPDSIFEKIRLLLRGLPAWMLPEGFDWGRHDNYCKLINPANGSTITGEGGDNIGRGGRKTYYDVDEAAFLEHPQSVDAALSNTCETVYYTSSANGPRGPFFDRRTNLPPAQVFRLEWLDDPRKNHWFLPNEVGGLSASGSGRDAPPRAIYPWYERQKAKNDPVVVASEVDIDYFASVESVAIPGKWVQPAISSSLFARTGLKVASLDIADEGGDDNVFMVRDGSLIEVIHAWSEGNTIQTAYKCLFYCLKYRVSRLVYDANGVGATMRGVLESISNLSAEFLGKFGDISDFSPLLESLNAQALRRRGEFALPFEFVGFPAGSRSLGDREWSEFGGRLSKEIFRDYKAETTWMVRRRFEKVLEVRGGVIGHDPMDLISIPNHGQLVSQISWPRYQYTDIGLIAIESKRSMKRRGLKSPDFLDALVMSFYQPSEDPSKGAADWLDAL